MFNNSLTAVNSKMMLGNLTQMQFSADSTNGHLNITLRDATSLIRYMFRIWTGTSRLTLYKSTNDGQSYTTLWDKTLT